MRNIYTLALLMVIAISHAQFPTLPPGGRLSGDSDLTVKLPSIDEKALIEEDKRNEHKNLPWRFASNVDVSYSLQNSGEWTQMETGDRIWRIRFISSGAKNMHFWLKNFYIPKGAAIYVYPEGHAADAEIYDDRHNQNDAYLGIWPVFGDDVWLEYYEPKNVIGQGKLEIYNVGRGYKHVHNKTTNAALALDCNYDVECYMINIDNLKNFTKRSVTHILAGNANGAFLASGALINNTANDGTPYILSANHAWADDVTYTFRFNYINPNPECPSSGDGDSSINANQTISGATLRARRAQTDFLLMELSSDPLPEWNVVWSGWDRSGTTPPSGYGVHHPAGDIMKVCQEFDSPIGLDLDNGEFTWWIQDWELGTTEGGSSGSPFLDNNGRILGQLWRGASACNGSLPNGAGDEYGRFDVSWDAGATPATRLKEWLDPGNTGSMTTDFYPPMPTYAVDAEIKFFAEGTNICGSEVQSIIRLVNNGTQDLTSVTIQYSVNNTQPQVINWSGNLQMHESELLQLPAVQGFDGENIFTIIATVNGFDENLGNNTLQTSFTNRSYFVSEVIFEMLTDGYGSDISWELTSEDGNVVYSGDSYDSFTSYSETLSLSEGCYLFTITDSYSDGLCCAFGVGNYSLIAGNDIIITGSDFGRTQSANFRIIDALSTPDHTNQNAIKVFPNPSSGIYTVTTVQNGSGYSYEVYSILGQMISSGQLAGTQNTLDISAAAKGIYMLKITNHSSESTTHKLIKE